MMSKTYLGNKYNFKWLRAWVKYPYTLEPHEEKAVKSFINYYMDLEKTSFGWFFEVYWKRDCWLSQNEINRLLKLVDEMETIQRVCFDSKEHLYIQNHPKYISGLFDESDGLEYFEVFENQRTGKPTLNIDYYPEEVEVEKVETD